MTNRHLKILFSGIVSFYISLVIFNNIADYASNFQFVEMVVGMEDTFSLSHNGWRSIKQPFLHHALLIFIILWETLVGICLWFGTYQMFRHQYSTPNAFRASKIWTTNGLALGIVLWFLVFLSVAGEWFLMWQSKTWNAQVNAFLLTICFLLFLLFHQSEEETGFK
ncbi:MAG: DUF2165 domain-containing protein [Saprospiraceae bacterium]|nr:DUF2165 domain-containing protein [Saprospiraceae bacterium]